jgi:hypothetical protein
VPLISSHLVLLCFQLWRLSASHDERHEVAARGGGPALVGNFLQMVELNARSGRRTRRGRELRMQNIRPHAIYSQSQAHDLLVGKEAQGGSLVVPNDAGIAQDGLFRVTCLKRSNRKESGISFPFCQA